jgi:hypothetical protein
MLAGSLARAGVQEFGDEPDRRVAAGCGERLVLFVGGAAGQSPAADDVEVCCHQRAHGLAPRTTLAVAWLVMLRRPSCSNRVGSVRPKNGS